MLATAELAPLRRRRRGDRRRCPGPFGARAPRGRAGRAAAFLAGDVDLRQRLRWLGVALAALVVTGPWVGYNLVRFRRPVLLSSQFGPLLASANCDTTYYGRLLGFFSIPCDRAIADREIDPGLDQSERDSIYRRERSSTSDRPRAGSRW
jgi:hypothetical protein